jgi:hypothetical protein
MPHVVDVTKDPKDFQKSLGRSFQSGHINFLIGSGAAVPAIPLAGVAEEQINALLAGGNETEARLRMYDFIAGVQDPMNRLVRDEPSVANSQTLAQYTRFLGLLETILFERRTTLLPKHVTIFTTNYDLFFEKAAIGHPALSLNDGFNRAPSLTNRLTYSPRNFFNVTYNTNTLYAYKVEVPSVNLIKLHGSLSWAKEVDDIIFRIAPRDLLPADMTLPQVNSFLDEYAVVLPQATKFRTTLLDRTYYDLLRIYANELDRENALLITFGFSFADEHLLDITRRALKNPTMRLILFAFDTNALVAYQARFAGQSNVVIVHPPAGEQIRFTELNSVIEGAIPMGML